MAPVVVLHAVGIERLNLPRVARDHKLHKHLRNMWHFRCEWRDYPAVLSGTQRADASSKLSLFEASECISSPRAQV